MSRSSSLLCLALTLAVSAPLGACNGDKGFVVSNIAPAVTIDSPEDGTVFQEGDPVEVLGRVRDDFDVTQLTIAWESSIDGTLADVDPPDPDGLVELITNNLSDGVHIITLRATDAGGEQAEDTVELEVLDSPDIPSLQILNPAPDVQPPVVGIGDRPFTFIAQATDASDAPEDLTIQVQADPGGFLCDMSPDGSGTGNCAAALPIGIYGITFTVTDTEGFSASAVTTLEFKDVAQVDQDGDGHTPAGGDCNDSATTIFPGAPEVCDGLDNDCDGTPDGAGSACWDDDGDGYCEAPPCSNASNTIPDCNDANPGAYPLATEICNNVDDNCDGQVDEGLPADLYYPDLDGDGYGDGTAISSCNGPPTTVPTASAPGDCDDSNPGINPGSTEIQNGYDDNCNGQIDEAGPTYDDDGDGYCEAPPCTNASGTSSDCDDANSSVNPGAVEVCGDGLDNNCDAITNEQNAVGCTNYYADADGDGHGSAIDSACFCDALYPYESATSDDCDDNSAQRYPGQTNYFASPANGSYDYDCSGSETPRWLSGSSGCQVAGIGCNGQDGWIGGTIPGCGTPQAYQDDCGLDYLALLAGCGASCFTTCFAGLNASCFQCLLSACPSNQVCDQDTEGRIQECR